MQGSTVLLQCGALLHVQPSAWDMLQPQQQFQISRLEVLVLSSKEKWLLLVLLSVLLCILLRQDSSISFPPLCAGQQSGQELLSSLTAFVFRGFVAANSAIQRLWRQRPWYLILKLLCSSFTESPIALGAVIPGPHPSGHSWFYRNTLSFPSGHFLYEVEGSKSVICLLLEALL